MQYESLSPEEIQEIKRRGARMVWLKERGLTEEHVLRDVTANGSHEFVINNGKKDILPIFMTKPI